jgi:hypothetical protein
VLLLHQGGWALVSEQLPYAVGAARSILLDRHLNPQATKVGKTPFTGEGLAPCRMVEGPKVIYLLEVVVLTVMVCVLW